MIDPAHPRRLSWRRVSQSGPPRKNGPRRLLLLALAIALPLIWTQVASDGAAPVAIAGGDEDDEETPAPAPAATTTTRRRRLGDDDADSGDDDDEGRPSLSDRVTDVRQELDSLSEEIEDLGEPVEEFETFDQCMYQLGVTQYGRRRGTGSATGLGDADTEPRSP